MSLWIRIDGREERVARQHCLLYFQTAEIEELFIFPDAPSPEEVDWRKTIEHFMNRPFEAFREPAVKANMDFVKQQLLANRKKKQRSTTFDLLKQI